VTHLRLTQRRRLSSAFCWSCVVWRPDEVVTVHEPCGANLDRGLAGLHSEDGGNCAHAGHAVVWSRRCLVTPLSGHAVWSCRVLPNSAVGSSTPPPAARRWLSLSPGSRACQAGPACCARPSGRARAGRPSGCDRRLPQPVHRACSSYLNVSRNWHWSASMPHCSGRGGHCGACAMSSSAPENFLLRRHRIAQRSRQQPLARSVRAWMITSERSGFTEDRQAGAYLRSERGVHIMSFCLLRGRNAWYRRNIGGIG
jgi:hypothetical protein